MYKIITFVPEDFSHKMIDIMAEAGAGVMGNYTHAAFITKGMGNWFSGEGTNPTIGEVGKMSREPECKIEMHCPEDKVKAVVDAIRKNHPYEEPAIEVYKLEIF